MKTATQSVVRELAERIRQMEASSRPAASCVTIPLGVRGLGSLFPQEEMPAGSLIEIVSAHPAAGAWTLSFLLAKYACGTERWLIVADHQQTFYPPAVRKFGLDLGQLFILRSPNPRDTLSALTQSLRCSAIGAAIGEFEHLPERDGRRLQLAAETGGGVGVLLRPWKAIHAPSFASLRCVIRGMTDRGAAQAGRVRNAREETGEGFGGSLYQRRMHIEVIRCRGGREGHSLILEMNDATAHVRVLPGLAFAANSTGESRSTA